MISAFFSDIEKIILSNCLKAKVSIKVAVAWFTNPKIFEAIEALHKNGVEVTIIVTDDRINFFIAKDLYHNLMSKKVPVYTIKGDKLMHHKFCLIDNKLLITGSYNWTNSAEKFNIENVILTNDKNLIDSYSEEFEKLISNSSRVKNIEAIKASNSASKKIEEIEYSLLLEKSKLNKKQVELANEDPIIPEDILDLIDDAEFNYLQGYLDNALSICNEIIKQHPNISLVYEIMANCKWRQSKYFEQIKYAQKAIEIDNQNYSAFNMLGIGYSHISNAQKSIENYQICINAEPDDFIYYRNRALSYKELEQDSAIPQKIKIQLQFKGRATKDFLKVIELTEKELKNEKSYKIYLSRGVAKEFLNQKFAAMQDFIKAKELYQLAPKGERDVHEFKEMKAYIKDLEKQIR